MITVAQRLAAAQRLLDGKVTDADGVWARAVVWILRVALEQQVDEVWQRASVPDMQAASMRAQLIVLRTVAGDVAADRAALLWHSLSHAAHHHDYELAPAVVELVRWQAEATEVVRLLRAGAPIR